MLMVAITKSRRIIFVRIFQLPIFSVAAMAAFFTLDFPCFTPLVTAVPPSPHCLDQFRILRVFLYLSAQIPDMDHDRIICSVIVRFLPDSLIETLR